MYLKVIKQDDGNPKVVRSRLFKPCLPLTEKQLFLEVNVHLTLSPMYLSAVEINCSQDWLMVYVSPDAQDGNNSFIFSDELILGQGCRATKIHTYRYDFVYLVSDCGIRTKVRMLLSVTLLCSVTLCASC